MSDSSLSFVAAKSCCPNVIAGFPDQDLPLPVSCSVRPTRVPYRRRDRNDEYRTTSRQGTHKRQSAGSALHRASYAASALAVAHIIHIVRSPITSSHRSPDGSGSLSLQYQAYARPVSSPTRYSYPQLRQSTLQPPSVQTCRFRFPCSFASPQHRESTQMPAAFVASSPKAQGSAELHHHLLHPSEIGCAKEVQRCRQRV